MLREEAERDRTLTVEKPGAQLASLGSTIALATCRSRVSDAQLRLEKAADAIATLGSRLDAALEVLDALRPDMDEIEGRLLSAASATSPPLGEAACVRALTGLVEALERRTREVLEDPGGLYEAFFLRCALAGAPVTVQGAEREVRGRWTGLHPELGLRVEGEGRTRHLAVAHVRDVRSGG